MKTVQLDQAGIQTIVDGLQRPIKQAQAFFSLLVLQVDTDTQTQFREEGAAGGPRGIPSELAWPPFKESTLRNPKSGTWKIRYGTDMKGKGMMGHYRPEARRYSFNSKMLQASGGFRQSFHIMNASATGMKYGTNHRLAGKIGSVPRREVLFITGNDKIRWGGKFREYIDKGIIF